MAEGLETVYDSYAGAVTWQRRKQQIPIDEVDAIPLVGMALLDGYKLTVAGIAGGKVTISELEQIASIFIAGRSCREICANSFRG